jgi:predicted dehydrogenase
LTRQLTSRREFLGAAAVGLGAAATRCATAREGTAAGHNSAAPELSVAAPAPRRKAIGANDRIRCGFIGVGRRASSTLQEVLKRDDVDVVAIADAYDVWRERALGWCKEKQPDVTGYVRFEELLDNEQLDSVFVGTPDHIHAPAILTAIDSGLDVYAEKPMTLNLEEAAAVRTRTRETGAVVQVGTQLRSTDIYQQARDAVQRGDIGKLVVVRVNRSYPGEALPEMAPPEEANSSNVHWREFLRHTRRYRFDLQRFFNWRQFREYSNGYTGDLMLHHLDICHFITQCGMPDHIMSSGGIFFMDDGRTRPDTVTTIAGYPEKFVFNYTTTVASGHYGHVERYIGTEGVIELRGMREMSIFRNEVEEVAQSEGLNDAGHVADFFDCMRSRRDPVAPVEAGFMGAVCCHMAVLSQESGESAKWDAETEQILL